METRFLFGALLGMKLTWAPAAFRQGAQGIYDAPPRAILENEFNTSNEDEIIKKILEEGEAQEIEVSKSMTPALDDMVFY